MTRSLFSPRHRRLCQLLRQARNDAGLTQTQLARKLRRPQSFVAKYEREERRLDVVEFLDVSSAMGADPFKILQVIAKGATELPAR